MQLYVKEAMMLVQYTAWITSNKCLGVFFVMFVCLFFPDGKNCSNPHLPQQEEIRKDQEVTVCMELWGDDMIMELIV